MFEEALLLAARYHKGQKRKNGDPYIFHPLKVALELKKMGYNETIWTVGVLHDVLEDTNVTEEEIIAVTGMDVFEIIKCLTKYPGCNKDDYFQNIRLNTTAQIIKNVDRFCNLLDLYDLGDNEKVFIEYYVKDTEKYFSDNTEINEVLEKIKKKYNISSVLKENLKTYYTVDSSLGDSSPLYKTNPKTGEAFEYINGYWVSCDPYFYVSMGDNAVCLNEAEAARFM